MSSNRQRLLSLLMVGVVLLTGASACVAPAAGPQVAVTRVPLDLASSLPDQPLLAMAQPAPLFEVATDGGMVLQVGAGDSQQGDGVEATPQPGASQAVSTTVSSSDLPTAVAEDPHQELASQQVNQDTAAGTPEADDGLRPLQRTHNILLLGTDQLNLNYVGRTDTIMVLALDQENGRAALVSFPRDIYLPIPGVGYSRINTAYPYGETRKPGSGIPLLISTIEKNFGIPIEHYVRIDFTGFKDVIDALGGVDITVDCPIYDDKNINIFGVYTLDAGDYHMNGQQALYYARSRKTTSDFDRARRQQQVLMALRKRVLDAGLIPRVPALWSALRDTVDTDLGAGDIVELARLGATLDNRHLYGMVLRYPLVTDWVTPQGGQVQLPDLPAIADALDGIWNRKPLNETNKEEKICP